MDTAASDHYAQLKAPLQNIQPILNAVPIYLTNGNSITASYTGVLPNIPQISLQNKTAQLYPDNNNISLVSIGKSYDDGCKAILDKQECTIYKENKPIITAPRYFRTGIYIMKLHKPIHHLAQATIASRQHKVININEFIDIDRIKCLHASLGGPPLRTVKQAIKAGYLQSWPGLTIKAINKLTVPDETILGHIDYVRQNKLSTKNLDEE